MKKVFFAIVFSLLATVAFALNWGDGYWTVQPSLLPDTYSAVPGLFIDGASFKIYFTTAKWPNLKYDVYFDANFSITNGRWVYTQWCQDHGWYWTGNLWQGRNNSTVAPIRGALYIDPYEKVAIYFFSSSLSGRGEYDVFRVRVLNND
jgi:hypothetical protein